MSHSMWFYCVIFQDQQIMKTEKAREGLVGSVGSQEKDELAEYNRLLGQ